MRIVLIISFCIIARFSFTQTIVFDDTIQGVNLEDKNTSLFPIIYNETLRNYILIDYNTLNILDLTDNANSIVKRYQQFLLENGSKFLGYTTVSTKSTLFFSNERDKKFAVIQFYVDKNSKQFLKKELPINLKKEDFMESFTIKDNFYILTIKKQSSTITLYKIKSDLSIETFTYDLNQNDIFKNYTLHDLVRNIGFKTLYDKINIGKITENPRFLNSYQFVKLYTENDKVILTVDDKIERTELFTINVNNGAFKYDYITRSTNTIKPINYSKYHYNSFLLDDTIYQILIGMDLLRLDIISMATKQPIKTYELYDDESKEMNFSNATLIKKGGLFTLEVYPLKSFLDFKDFNKYYINPKANKEKEIENDKKFLKKLFTDNVVITAYKTNKQFYLKIGSYHHYVIEGGMFMNKNNKNYLPLQPKKIILGGTPVEREHYFNLILDENYNATEIDYKLNKYDIIYDFYNAHSENIIDESLFKLGNDLYLSYRDTETNTFKILKF